MKEFLKFTLASIVGTVVSLFLVFFIFFIIIAGAISSALSDLDRSKKAVKITDGSVLHLQLNRPISDRGPDQDFQFSFAGFSSGSVTGLNHLLEAIEKAKADERIAGIYLDVSFLLTGTSSVQEIRNALLDFKESGKWIVGYSEILSQKGFYLASVADELYIYPEGVIDFRGLSVSSPYLRSMFRKLEIEPQVIRGTNNKFKSAAEPFLLDEMSQASRVQTEAWLGSIWDAVLEGMAASLEMEKAELRSIANTFAVRQPSDAAALNLITSAKHQDEVTAVLREKLELKPGEKLRLISLGDYRRSAGSVGRKGKYVPSYKKDKIAVVYAEGDIISGKSSDGSIGSETFAEALREAREDSTVKAVVLRVNSPGGSALASDVIYRETELMKGVKPLIVSMGDVAASGGYYISARADKIFAMPTTITGSIGVIMMLPNMKGFLNNKLGIHIDGVKTDTYADFGDVSRPLNDGEFHILQQGVDRTYDRFVNIVASGRHTTYAKIDSVGQGRVWSGVDALALGLVDTLGGLNDAIATAARMAKIEDFAVKNLPKRKDPIEEFFESMQARMVQSYAAKELGNDAELINYLKYVKSIRNSSGMQMREFLYTDVE